MASALAPKKLKRYKEIAGLLLKYGRSDAMKGAGLDDALGDEAPGSANGSGNGTGQGERKGPSPEELADDLERMGPVYVKLGQVLSSRADLIAPEYLKGLARLQDSLEPLPFETIQQIVEEELGVRLTKAFSEFEREPVATASLGQVHRAALRDGRRVVVKVQRPGVREQIAEDMEALSDIAGLMDKHTQVGKQYQFSDILEEFRDSLVLELDYRREANNLRRLNRNLREFAHIVVPLPINDYCTSRVLTMEYVEGRKVTSLSRVAMTELDGTVLADELLQAYLKQILVDGFFHADPHPGNVFITPDGRLALIDLGMVGYLAPDMQDTLLKLLVAVSEGRSDEAANEAIDIAQRLEGFDEEGFRAAVSDLVLQNRSTTVEDARVGRAILEFSSVGIEHGLRMPAELTLLGKTLLHLDEIGRVLDPEMNPNDAIRRHAMELAQRRLTKSFTAGNLLSAAIESKELLQEGPGRLNRILDALASNKLRVGVDALDENTLIEGFQKVANRITVGLVLAALIIGASMLMRVQTRFQILGYPGFAMICFLAAAVGGAALVASIALRDRDTGGKAT